MFPICTSAIKPSDLIHRVGARLNIPYSSYNQISCDADDTFKHTSESAMGCLAVSIVDYMTCDQTRNKETRKIISTIASACGISPTCVHRLKKKTSLAHIKRKQTEKSFTCTLTGD